MLLSRNLQLLVSLALSSWLVACGQMETRTSKAENSSEKVIAADAQPATISGYCWLEETGEVLSRSEYEDYKSFWGGRHPKDPVQNDDPKQNDDPWQSDRPDQNEDHPGQNDDGKKHRDKDDHKLPDYPDKGRDKLPDYPVKEPLPPSKDVDSCPPVKGK